MRPPCDNSLCLYYSQFEIKGEGKGSENPGKYGGKKGMLCFMVSYYEQMYAMNKYIKVAFKLFDG